MTLSCQRAFKNVLKKTRRKRIYLLQPSNETRKKKVKCVDSLAHTHYIILSIVKVKKKAVSPCLKNVVKTVNILSLTQNPSRGTNNTLCSTLSSLLQGSCPPQRISGASARSCSMSRSIHLSVPLQTPYRFELLRLSTFHAYPNKATSCLLLARDGFLCMGTGADDMVTCYCCHARKGNWLENDVVSEVHKSLSPFCPMVKGINCNNIPVNPGEKSFENLLNILSDKVVHEMPHHRVPNSDLLRGISTNQSKKLCADDNVDGLTMTQVDQRNAGKRNENVLLSAGEETRKLNKTVASSIQEKRNSYSVAADSDTFDVHPSLEDISLSEMGARADLPPPGPVKRKKIKQFFVSVKKKLGIKTKDRGDEICQESMKLSKESRPIAQNLKNMNARKYPITKRPPKDSPRNRNSTVELGKSITVNIHETYRKNYVVKKSGTNSKFTELGTITEKPLCVDLAKKSNRINTFKSYSKLRRWQIKNLADAGFYCKDGSSTAVNVQCFFCGWKFSNWEQEDDVWLQHALHSPNCSFVKQKKGQHYIEEVQEKSTSALVRDTMGVPVSSIHQGSILYRDPAVKVSMEFLFSQNEVGDVAQKSKTEGQGSKRFSSHDVLQRELKKGRTPTMSEQSHTRNWLTVPSENIEAQLLKMQNKKLRLRTMCKICRDRKMEFVFLPCGHFIACKECANASVNCKLCEKPIKERVRAYIN